MEESAPKRRRTSPTTAVDVPSPSHTPPDDTAPKRTRTKRPSFASPTKASLARHNPGVLDRRRSSSPQKPAQSTTAARRSASPAPAERDAPASDLGREEDAVQRTEEITPGSERSIPRPRGGMAAAARRSSVKPNPRPLPPPAPEDEEDFNPFAGRTLRRSPGSNAPAGSLPAQGRPREEKPAREPTPEPELPPSVPDAVSSTPPRGIHSSPLRWREKQKPKRSSPLKAPPTRPPRGTSIEPAATTRSLFGAASSARPVEPEPEPEDEAVRKLRAFDPFESKRKEVQGLEEEINNLKRDLEVAQKENERIRATQRTGRVLALADQDATIGMLRRHQLSPDSQSRPTAAQRLVKMVLNPISILPFSKPCALARPTPSDSADMADIKSHHPLPMKAAEALPYLELFSAFSLTSSFVALSPNSDGAVHQHHFITLRSREVPGLFTSRMELTVNPTNLSIIDIKVPALEPAAKSELGPFIDQLCSGDCNRSMLRNTGILSWAMGEWVRVATARASFWARLEKSLGSKAALRKTVAQLQTRARNRSRRTEDDDDEQGENDAVARADLLRFMGQDRFTVSIPAAGAKAPVSLQFAWRVEFDWTGEAQSKLAVTTGIPGQWHHIDERGSLATIPKLFAGLVEGGEGPEKAVKTIVALVAGEV